MGARRIRREQRQADQKESRQINGMRKTKERVRRDQRMLELVRKGTYPYTPAIRSWLSQQLDKPSARIEPADVQRLISSS